MAETAESPLSSGLRANGGGIYDVVKHRFVHMCLHADWLHQPLQIDINRALVVSVHNGAWHGAAQYIHTEETGGAM